MSLFDEETERYLKEFRPREIREFVVVAQGRSVLWTALIAAAAAALCVGGIFWFARHASRYTNHVAYVQPPALSVTSGSHNRSIMSLTSLGFTDNKRLEVLLAEESRKSLPAFQGEHSSLKVLAKD
jgi:hypothetical protein